MDNEALPRETVKCLWSSSRFPRLDQYKNYPKDDVIQAVTMEELKSALYNLSLQNSDTLQDQKIIIVIFLLLSKVSGRL